MNPLLRQIRAGKKLGIAWDVFVQAAAAKVMGKVTYHTAVVPFGTDRTQCLNNKITAAFMITESASPHQMRCPQPIGLGIPDLVTRTAQQRIKLALTAIRATCEYDDTRTRSCGSLYLHTRRSLIACE